MDDASAVGYAGSLPLRLDVSSPPPHQSAEPRENEAAAFARHRFVWGPFAAANAK